MASSIVELEIWQVDFARIASFDQSTAGGRDRSIDQPLIDDIFACDLCRGARYIFC